MTLHIDPDILLNAYAQGMFPMAEAADGQEVFWVRPQWRGIIELKQFHVPRSLAKFACKTAMEIHFDRDFVSTLDGCAAPHEGRETTWINQPIREVYLELFARGHCHSIEAWIDDRLVGGLYGVHIGAAFFGESMFSYLTNASKLCLITLVQHLQNHSFHLLDTQFLTPHLAQFGAIEISCDSYEKKLQHALSTQAFF